MRVTYRQQREHLNRLDDASGKLGLPCEDGIVTIFLGKDGYPSGEVSEMELDCTAADPASLLDYITSRLFQIAYQKGERDAMTMIRIVIGAAPIREDVQAERTG